MRGILDDRESFANRGIGIAIYDGVANEDALLFSNQQGDSSPGRETTGIEHIIDFNGTRWLLRFSRLPGVRIADSSAAGLALLGGSVSSVLLFLLILSLSRTRNSALHLAEKLTAEAREREEQLKASELRWRFAMPMQMPSTSGRHWITSSLLSTSRMHTVVTPMPIARRWICSSVMHKRWPGRPMISFSLHQPVNISSRLTSASWRAKRPGKKWRCRLRTASASFTWKSNHPFTMMIQSVSLAFWAFPPTLRT